MAKPGRPEIHFHINPREADSWRGRERLAIYNRLAELCEAHGLAFHAQARPRSEMEPREGAADGNLHIVENGRMQGEGWLNTALAYIKGFWHLDPRGIQAESSARDASFLASEVDQAAAQAFFRDMRKRFVTPRLSRFRQPRAMATDLPDGAVALFLQGRSAYHAARCHVPMDRMILAVAAGSGGRPVIVKPHPQALELGAEAIDKARAAGAQFQLTDANVHDVLAAASVTVSVNSAVAMEGFLHRKPAILFGESDFPDLVARVREAEDFPQVLEEALSLRWPFVRMLHWYFSRHTLELAAPDFEDRAFAAFEKVGFPKDRLGIKS